MSDGFYVLMGAGLVLVFLYIRQRFAAFPAQKPWDYTGGPAFDVQKHLNGDILCDGVVYGPTGRVVSRFTGDFDVEWHGDTGVMRETFRYDDGTSRDRAWQLTLQPGGLIEARAEDVVGLAHGVVSGPAVQLRYRIRLPASAGGHVLDTVDWMYLTPDGTIVNRSQFRKFGIKVAELIATMRPADARAPRARIDEAA